MANLIQRFLDWGEGWFSYHARHWYRKHKKIRIGNPKEARVADILQQGSGIGISEAAKQIQERLNG